MRRIFLCFLSVMLLSASARAEDAATGLTLLTDPALMLPLTELARDYAREQHVSVTVVATEGHDVAQQIGQGLDAHLLITADQPLLDTLNAHGLIDVFGKRSIARTREVEYQAVLVASEALEPSRAFLGYLQTTSAQAVFRNYGFEGKR